MKVCKAWNTLQSLFRIPQLATCLLHKSALPRQPGELVGRLIHPLSPWAYKLILKIPISHLALFCPKSEQARFQDV
ncbi:hypothetical protein AG1IA_09153 [Rhizoctonia solani AG-1 IA]|uniref:Uncharacterized protein n=1 Tax=Thanatephorus cucumeris (strain AG1-IA) TaxID=983506 RepID=L8WFU8_THACA|nr:hypothetical protein AG1IA_09153 [Rhizoctonia solani AG-1 IA]